MTAQAVISANEFTALLREHVRASRKVFQLRGATIVGDVEIGPEEFRVGLQLRDLSFANRVVFRGCVFRRETSFCDCKFREGLDISGNTFEARFVLLGCSFGLEGLPSDEQTLVADFATFAGDFCLADIKVSGATRVMSSRIGGNLFFVCSQFAAAGKTQTPLDLSQTEVRGSFYLNGWVEPHLRELLLRDSFGFASGSERRSWHRATEIRAEEKNFAVNFSDLQVKGYLSVFAAQILTGLDCTNLKAGFLEASLARIEGDLTLSGAEIPGLIRCNGAHIGGAVIMIAGRSGQIEIDDYISDGFVNGSAIEAILISAWTCTDWARFSPREVGQSKTKVSAHGIRGIYIAASKFADDLTFAPSGDGLTKFEQTFAADVSQWILDHACVMTRGVDTQQPVAIHNCEIGGSLTFRNLRTSQNVMVTDSTVKGVIDFSATFANQRGRSRRGVRVFIQLMAILDRADLKEDLAERIGARAASIDFTQTKAGAIDITGLALEKSGEDSSGSAIFNHVTVERTLAQASRTNRSDLCEMIGELLSILPAVPPKLHQRKDPLQNLIESIFEFLVRPEVAGAGLKSYLENRLKSIETTAAAGQIPGALRLANARVGRLTISTESFNRDARTGKETSAANAEAAGIVLDNAKIDELCVYRAKDSDTGNGFPRPVSLRDVSISSWRLEERQEGGPAKAELTESTRSDLYLDMLDNDPEYRAATYLNIEKLLRDRGHEQAAREVFIAGAYRARRADIPSNSVFAWRPGYGRFRRKRLLPFFRLRRPIFDTLEAVALMLGLVFLLAMLPRIYDAVIAPEDMDTRVFRAIVAIAVPLILLPILLRWLRRPAARLFDRLYWTVLDYGTSAFRLMAPILALAIISMTFVAPLPSNFEATAEAVVAMQNNKEFRPTCVESSNWGYGDALWMTIRYHIPLVNLGILDDCQASDQPLRIRYLVDSGAPPSWWAWIGPWPNARDWFGVMSVLNYILWPLFIPFLLRKALRQDRLS